MGAMEEVMDVEMAILKECYDLDTDVLECSPPKRSLCDLPSELIGMIAECLSRKDVHTLWCLRNRDLSQAIDHVWADAYFSSLKFKTTDPRGIARLTELACSRFAHRIRAIEICFHLKCNPDNLHNRDSPCMKASLEPAMITALGNVFSLAGNLGKILLRAPVRTTEIGDHLLLSPLPSFQNSNPIPDLQFQSPGHYAFGHVIDTASMCDLFNTIIHTIEQYLQHQVQEFGIIGFADTEWQSALVPTKWLHTAMLNKPALQHIKTLDLQFETFTFSSDDTILAVVGAIEKNVSLQVLKLRAGPRSIKYFHDRSEWWAPLLSLLGTDPPFRLRTLEIDGLVTSTDAPTLDNIIAVHVSTLRRLVFEHLNFHFPNSLRALYDRLTKTDINYFSTKYFFIHERHYLVSGVLQYREVEDEVLKWEDEDSQDEDSEDKDESYRDWIDVSWLVSSQNRPLVFENEDGRKSKNWMRRNFESIVGLIVDGAVWDGQ